MLVFLIKLQSLSFPQPVMSFIQEMATWQIIQIHSIIKQGNNLTFFDMHSKLISCCSGILHVYFLFNKKLTQRSLAS